jgi:tetratricopeptide (TPR) repeat protein/outer membrane protein OmpA-like peptidoglycan-associated protein
MAQPKKDKALFRLAMNEYNQYRYAYAIPIFKSYLQKTPTDTIALKLISESYQKLNAYDSALVYLEKAVSLGIHKDIRLAELYASNNQYDKAKILYATFLSDDITKLNEARLYGFKNIDKLKADSLDYKLTNLKINTPFNEFNSVLYKDGLIFESNRMKLTPKPKQFFKRLFTKTPKPSEFAWDGAGYSKLYYFENIDSIRSNTPFTKSTWVEKSSKTNYTDYSTETSNDSKKVPSVYNSYFPLYNEQGVTSFNTFIQDKLNIGAVSFTADGKKAYYTRNQKKSSNTYQLEIWEAYNIGGNWVGAHKLFFNNPKYSYFHPSITSDGKRLYYVSDDPAGQGGTDIYYVDQNEDGSWKNTVNLGQDINTAANELFPTFYEGSLYISSNGHPGLGGLDIYRLTRNNKGLVSLKNMGYPINSNKDDFAFNIKGEKGFISSNRYGSDDIIAFDHIISFIKMRGKVLVDSNCVPGKKVYLQQLNEQGKLVTIDSAIVDEHCIYEFSARPNQTYTLMAYTTEGDKFEQTINTEGYVKTNDTYLKEASLMNIPLPDKEKLAAKLAKEAELASMTKTFRLTIDSLKAIAKDYVELHHPFDQVYIIEKDLADYYKIIEMVKRIHNKKIVIVSAADCNGSLDYNEDLSARRANRIYRTLSKLSDNEVIIKNVGERELLKACDDLKKSIDEQVVNRYSYVFILDKK